MRRIYLDHAATTPMLPEVREAMLPWLNVEFGNPSSLHAEGRKAKEAIDAAREILSDSIGSLFAEVLFTSSGTEAANLAIVGAALANDDPKRNRILVSAAEHHCVLHLQPLLEKLGYKVELIPVTSEAETKPDAVKEKLSDNVLMVCVMHANNELGTINDIAEIGSSVKANGSLMMVDAVQTYGVLPINVKTFPIDLLTFAAHKLYGPKGVGAIYIRAGTKVKPILYGGGQEREMRAGTENVGNIVGFAEAVKQVLPNDEGRLRKRQTRDTFLAVLMAEPSAGVRLTVDPRQATPILPGHIHLRFPGISAESMLIRLDRMGISASSGAACSSGSLEPSHVLLACGYTEQEASKGLRFTFGIHTTVEDAKEAAARVVEAASQVRGTKSSPIR
ncbi:MAG: cysteine desulfurase [Fimbriimonadaceae bacterium]|nr:cysteine desulfurase [Fimbriimonadaceae bacterium]